MESINWYRSIKKPSWAPADKVFGQVWAVLYVIIFFVNIYLIAILFQGYISWVVILPFWINLFANFIFTPIQFGLKNNLLALLDIIIILTTIIWSMISIWPINNILALAYAPYLIWVCIATVLQISITWLNRKSK